MQQRKSGRTKATLIVAASVYGAVVMVTALHGRADGFDGGSISGGGSGFLLTGARPAPPSTIASYIRDNDTAIALGKALFWDAQAGSDGRQACASCHFNAGSDNRATNTLNPGHNGVFDQTSTGHSGPNATITAGDFPFHRLTDINDNGSTVAHDTDDDFGSQGVLFRSFNFVGASAVDSCTDQSDPVFNVNGHNVRRVTSRQASTTINAAFNYRNFWDGRARENFNGVNPSGQTDLTARIFRNINGVITPVRELIDHSSAASQATGPTLSPVEMSCDGRTWPNVGRKLLLLTPLAGQTVSPTDSVLGALVNTDGRGLNTSYTALIMAAFQADLWNGVGTVTIGGTQFSQIEANFSLFWGLAIQAYESTLVSDDTPIDRYLTGNRSALSSDAIAGLDLFQGQARCVECHSGPTFSRATEDGGKSFVNIGVRPTAEDTGDVVDAGKGRFKVPTLRNIELLGPYFHNGGQATLHQVVDFYNRGGDFPNQDTDSQIRPLGLSEEQKHSLVSFLLSLTDDRVRYQRAPFDHPGLCLPNAGDNSNASCLPAVGAGGSAAPLGTFLNLDPYQR
ncbi:MAG TPA: cytochrome c peroxidase [Vicinamibacterales bacterium]|nr:cytochrome c peroxidase [Vicinamibacterales bacterium]